MTRALTKPALLEEQEQQRTLATTATTTTDGGGNYDLFRPNMTSSLLKSFDQLLLDSIQQLQSNADSDGSIHNNTTSTTDDAIFLDPTSGLIFIPKQKKEDNNESSSGQNNAYDTNSSATSSSASEFQYRLAHVYIFVPFTGNGGLHNRGGADDVLAAMLGIHRLHLEMEEGYASSVLGSCNIRLSASFVDTGLSPIQATQQLNQILSSDIGTDLTITEGAPQQHLPVTAVLGGFTSAVTSPLAILTGLNEIVQISHGATAKSLDVKEQYPYLGRTVPSNSADGGGEATAAIEFLQNVAQTTHLAILFIATDAFGSSLEKEISQLAQQRGISTQAYAFSASVSDSSDSSSEDDDDNNNNESDDDDTTLLLLQDVMQRVKASDVKHIYAICSEQQLESWLVAAKQANILGPDYFWFFPGLEMDTLLQQQQHSIAPLMHGAAVLQMQGGITTEPVLVGGDDEDNQNNQQTSGTAEKSPPSHLSGYSRFLESWTRAREDDEFMAYIQSKLGVSTNFDFSDQPLGMRPFMYDAMTSLGHALCLAEGTASNNTEFISGSDIFDAFRNKVDIHDGASGVMKIDKETGSRDPTTVNFVLWNVQEVPKEDGQSSVLSMTPYGVYIQNSWTTIGDRSFLFHDGSSTPPNSLGEVSIDFNYLGTATRAVGYTLAVLAIALVVIAWIWTFVNSSNPIVRRSNPAFLYALGAGVLLMNMTTIFRGVDETTASRQDFLDASCMAAPFFYTSGVSLIVGALITKTLELYKAYLNPEQKYLDVSKTKVFWYSSAILASNLLICVIWKLVSPLTWNREITSAQDRYGRSIESFGRCYSDQSNIFIITLLAINACIVMIAIFLSFRAQNIETEYGESVYIAVAQAGMLQSWLIGVPLLAAVQENPQGSFLVEAFIVFLTGVGVVLLIYVPKISGIRKETVQRNKSDSNGDDTTEKKGVKMQSEQSRSFELWPM